MSVSFENTISRRSFVSLSAMAAASALAGCTSISGARQADGQLISFPKAIRAVQPPPAPTDAELAVMYGPIEDGGFLIPAVPYQQIDPPYYRQRVLDPTGEASGTIVVDTPSRFLYFCTAIRSGVPLERPFRRAAGACSARTSSTSMIACRSKRRSSSSSNSLIPSLPGQG
jgi:hypothetical protein